MFMWLITPYLNREVTITLLNKETQSYYPKIRVNLRQMKGMSWRTMANMMATMSALIFF